MRSAILSVLGAAAIASLAPAPATAQVSDRVIDVYGSDRCPASNGQEIVVCRRHAEGERFRIPPELRDSGARPSALGSTAAQAVNSTGGNAKQVQSCNAIGAGVNAGCLKSQIDAARAERRRDAAQGDAIP